MFSAMRAAREQRNKRMNVNKPQILQELPPSSSEARI